MNRDELEGQEGPGGPGSESEPNTPIVIDEHEDEREGEAEGEGVSPRFHRNTSVASAHSSTPQPQTAAPTSASPDQPQEEAPTPDLFASSHPSSWNCQVCSSANLFNLEECIMCSAPRPPSASPPPISSAPTIAHTFSTPQPHSTHELTINTSTSPAVGVGNAPSAPVSAAPSEDEDEKQPHRFNTHRSMIDSQLSTPARFDTATSQHSPYSAAAAVDSADEANADRSPQPSTGTPDPHLQRPFSSFSVDYNTAQPLPDANPQYEYDDDEDDEPLYGLMPPPSATTVLSDVDHTTVILDNDDASDVVVDLAALQGTTVQHEQQLTPVRLSSSSEPLSAGSISPLSDDDIARPSYDRTISSSSVSYYQPSRVVSPMPLDGGGGAALPLHSRGSSYAYPTMQNAPTLPFPIDEEAEMKEVEVGEQFTDDEPGMEQALSFEGEASEGGERSQGEHVVDVLPPAEIEMQIMQQELADREMAEKLALEDGINQRPEGSPMASDARAVGVGVGVGAAAAAVALPALKAKRNSQSVLSGGSRRPSALQARSPQSRARSKRASESKLASTPEARRAARKRALLIHRLVYFPWFTSLLCIGQIVLFVLMVGRNGWSFQGFSDNPMYGPSAQVLLHYGARFTPLVLNGEPWRIVTSIFLNSGVIQLAYSLLITCVFGIRYERVYGCWRMLPAWFIGAILGQLVSVTLSSQVIDTGAASSSMAILACFVGDFVWTHTTIHMKWMYLMRAIISLCCSFFIFIFPFTGSIWAFVAASVGSAFASVAFFAPFTLLRRGCRDLTLPAALTALFIPLALIGIATAVAFTSDNIYTNFLSIAGPQLNCVAIQTPWNCNPGIPPACFTNVYDDPSRAGWC